MEKEVSKAAFSLCAYKFVKVEMNLDSIDPNSKYSIKIIPSGIFTPDSGIYQLSFTFKAKVDEKKSSTLFAPPTTSSIRQWM